MDWPSIIAALAGFVAALLAAWGKRGHDLSKISKDEQRRRQADINFMLEPFKQQLEELRQTNKVLFNDRLMWEAERALLLKRIEELEER